MPHPIPYQGSKRHLAAAILAYAPTRFARLVEPFAGSAAITLAAAGRWPAAQFWLNDAHRPLAALWREIIARPARLADRYERLWHDQAGREREFFDDIRDAFNRTRQSEHLLYLLARCVKAAVRYNAAGQFNNTPDNRRRGTRPEAMRRRIRAASTLLARRTRVTGMDYRRVLAACQEDDLVYLDPPYQGVTDSRDRALRLGDRPRRTGGPIGGAQPPPLSVPRQLRRPHRHEAVRPAAPQVAAAGALRIARRPLQPGNPLGPRRDHL